MRRSSAIISAALTAVLLLSTVSSAFAVTQDDLRAHQEAARSARERAARAKATAKRLAGEVEELDQEIESIQRAAQALEPRISEATKRTDRLDREVREIQSEVTSMQAEIEQTEADYERQQELLAQRVEETYRQGNWFYFDILLGSEDVGDLITRTELVSRIIDANNDIAASLLATEKQLSKAKRQLDRTLKAVDLKRDEAAKVEKQLRSLKAQRDAAAAQRASVQRQKASLVAQNKANAKRLLALAEQEEAESQRIAAELSRATGSGVYGGVMAWPVPASQRITSSFGWRIHPIFGTKRFHAGVDIGAGQGTAIVAAGPGTVISAGYRGGYGNTVMIDHGNGVVSLYAHQVSGGIAVSSGQKVTRGQRIGAVGSTGYSTGPHLHFEVRVNGQPRNPMNYM